MPILLDIGCLSWYCSNPTLNQKSDFVNWCTFTHKKHSRHISPRSDVKRRSLMLSWRSRRTRIRWVYKRQKISCWSNNYAFTDRTDHILFSVFQQSWRTILKINESNIHHRGRKCTYHWSSNTCKSAVIKKKRLHSNISVLLHSQFSVID